MEEIKQYIQSWKRQLLRELKELYNDYEENNDENIKYDIIKAESQLSTLETIQNKIILIKLK